MNKTDRFIRAIKSCSKALAKLQYKEYLRNQNQVSSDYIKYNPSGEINVYKRN